MNIVELILIFFIILSLVFLMHANIFSLVPYIRFLYLFDDLTFFIILLTLFIIYISFISSMQFNFSSSLILSIVFIVIVCVLVFSTSNLFVLYFCYESSLIPIIYIILK